MKIIFVRHGHHKNNHLTRLGKKQAKLSYYDLYYEDIKKIYCSPLGRAVETANIISKKLGIKEITLDDRLKERQRLRGEAQTEKEKLYNDNYLTADFSMSDPEGCKEFIDRIFSFLNDAIKDNLEEDKNILIVGHSSILYVLNTYFTGIPKNRQLIWMRLGNCNKIVYEKLKK